MNRLLLKLFLLPVIAIAAHACGGNGTESNENVPEPYIESITSDYDGKAVAGMPVTLHGLNFSPVVSDNKVLYGIGLDAVAIPVSEATADHIVFKAPTVTATQLKIRASVKGKESNSVVLEYTTPQDPPEEEDPWSDIPTLDFAKLGGTTKTLVEGVEWTTFHGKWEGQIRNINSIRTTLNEHNKLGIYFSYYDNSYPDEISSIVKDGEDPRDLDKKCIYVDALTGTNGPMACCHFVRIDGVNRRAAVETDNYFTANCAFTIDDGVVNIVKVKDNYAAARLKNQTVGCAGPLLVWEGKIQEYPEDNSADFLKTTHPRTAFGISKDGKTVVQVAVDGRWTNSSSAERAIGMSTPLLSKMMQGLGCYKAMNFDGGGGTAMWVYGEGNARNIVNHVCENRTDDAGNWVWNWNGTKLRPTGNAVYIKSDLKKK